MNGALATVQPTAISVYERADPVQAVEKFGTMVAKSKLFGCKTVEQGQALVLMAMSENLSITEMRRRYHIVGDGNLSMRADYMLAEFRRQGGTFRWINQGDAGDEARLAVKYRENEIEVVFTIEDAKRQGLVKQKSRWETDPGSMLRARATTKAVRMVCPEVIAGFPADDEIEQPGVVQASEPPPVPKGEPRPIEPAMESMATLPQINQLAALFDQLAVPVEAKQAALAKRGARDLGDLTREAAAELLEKLQVKASHLVAQPSDEAGEAAAGGDDQPASEQQIEEVRNLLRQIAQSEGPVLAQQLKSHLDEQQLKLADLTHGEITELIHGLSVRNLTAFFDRSLESAKNA